MEQISEPSFWHLSLCTRCCEHCLLIIAPLLQFVLQLHIYQSPKPAGQLSHLPDCTLSFHGPVAPDQQRKYFLAMPACTIFCMLTLTSCHLHRLPAVTCRFHLEICLLLPRRWCDAAAHNKASFCPVQLQSLCQIQLRTQMRSFLGQTQLHKTWPDMAGRVADSPQGWQRWLTGATEQVHVSHVPMFIFIQTSLIGMWFSVQSHCGVTWGKTTHLKNCVWSSKPGDQRHCVRQGPNWSNEQQIEWTGGQSLAFLEQLLLQPISLWYSVSESPKV